MIECRQPKITIITVCYNELEENINLTFKNISSQSYGNREWIVIDGGSKPQTISEIKKYAIDKFVSEPDKGIYDAMNKGLAFATGDFVIFMNVGDSFYSLDTLEQIVNFIVLNPQYDCYYGDVIAIDSEGKEWENRQERRINRFVLHNTSICHQAIISRRYVFNKTGDFDINYNIVADRNWVIKSLAVAAKWIYIGFYVCRYDRTGFSSNSEKFHIENIRLIRNNYNVFERLVYTIARKIRGLWRRLQRIGIVNM